MFDRWFRLAERFVAAQEKCAEAQDRHSRRYEHADTRVETWRVEEMAMRAKDVENSAAYHQDLRNFFTRYGEDQGRMIAAIAELREKVRTIVGDRR